MIRASVLLAAVLSLGAQAGETQKIDLGGGVSLEVVKIPAGSFEMGSPSSETGRARDEDRHRVTLGQEFWIGRTPVTRGQFARFVQDSGYKTEAEKGTSGGFGFDGAALVQRKDFTWRNPGFTQTDDHPVVIVTYDDAIAFTRWLARKSHLQVTLPSEAQWEYACRAGTTSRYYSGDDDADAERIAWFKKNAGAGTQPVAGKAANAYGLHDMSGNVYQWCSDLYAAYLPGGGEVGPMDKPRRVLRGGSWFKDVQHVRSAARARNTPGSRNADNGFRIVVGMAAPTPTPAPAAIPVPPPPSTPSPSPIETPIPEPEPYQAPSRRDSGGMDCIVAVIIIFFILAVLIIGGVLIARSRRNQMSVPAPMPPLGRVPPRIVDDGFWFNTSGYRAGDVVTYTYTGPNGPVTEQFMIEPGSREQFVYTGLRPGDVFLANMIANQMNQQPPPPPLFRPSSQRSDWDDDRPRRSPPAY